jgi:hypothetical protein
MKYTTEEIVNCLKLRCDWYQKSIDIVTRKIEWVRPFDFPDGEVKAWNGAIRELQNTINMMEAK